MSGPTAHADMAHPSVVTTNPVDWTPNVKDGTIKDYAVVGNKVITGGTFTQVKEPGRVTLVRNYIFAFELGTGRVDVNFIPAVNGVVLALHAGPNNTVYVGGAFTYVNGVYQPGITQLDVSTGQRVSGFGRTRVTGGVVHTMAGYGNQLYIGGTFKAVSGIARTALARLDATSGAVDPNFNLKLTEPRLGSTSYIIVRSLAVTPDNTRLAFDGSFTKVNGQRRPQLAMADTSVNPVQLANWHTEEYADMCYSKAVSYMREIDFAPDGSYFVVVTDGRLHSGSLCDSAARWETFRSGTNLKPTWVNFTGGDSLYTVSVTGVAVYVGGHQRWLDNPYGRGTKGAGAVDQPAIGVIHPTTGRAKDIGWYVPSDRGHGIEALYAHAGGLLLGRDTGNIAGEWRERVAMFPLP